MTPDTFEFNEPLFSVSVNCSRRTRLRDGYKVGVECWSILRERLAVGGTGKRSGNKSHCREG